MIRALLRLGSSARLLCLALIGLWGIDARAGYTHYYTWHQKPDPTALKACIAEMGRVIEARKSILANGEGEGAASVEPMRVEFNGRGEAAHEPFLFPGDEEFNFCKTEYKPYDEVVTACLLVARDHFSPSVLEIASDGSWNNGDWQAGAKLFTSVTGHPASNPMVEPSSPVGLSRPRGTWLLLIGAAVIAVVLTLLKRFLQKPR